MTRHAILPALVAAALTLGLATAQSAEPMAGAVPGANAAPYYVQAAQYNDLNKFRHLRPGSTLVVPPLVSAEQGGQPRPGAVPDGGRPELRGLR